VLDHGTEALLLGMRPLMRWRPPVLEVEYDYDQDLHLGGRGLRLVPSYFCRRVPVALADPDLPPTLVYPVNHDYTWKRQLAAGSCPERALAALLGSTRSRVLAAIGRGATTTDLAYRLSTSPSSVSRHTTVLREAGIITSYRNGPSVVHTMTPLGAALLSQARLIGSPG
jgi:DNA-binding transcriptional ArsR family regulator